MMKYRYRDTDIIVESSVPLDSTSYIAVKKPEPVTAELKKPDQKPARKTAPKKA